LNHFPSLFPQGLEIEGDKRCSHARKIDCKWSRLLQPMKCGRIIHMHSYSPFVPRY
jgi:hypothetical protein